MIDKKYASVFITEAVSSCLLCKNPPCSTACSSDVPCAQIIKALRFDNFSGACAQVRANAACVTCAAPDCMHHCIKGAVSVPVAIHDIMTTMNALEDSDPLLKYGTTDCAADVSLATDLCGIACENPFFLSSSVVASDYEMIAKAFDAGWAGIAFKTIGSFVPEEVSPRFSAVKTGTQSFNGFKNIEQISDHTPEENFSCISKLKKKYPSKVIIASIMGRSADEWKLLAQQSENAGADCIECNFSCPHMASSGLGSDVGQSPELVAEYTAAVKSVVKIPVLAKMTPNISHMEIPADAAVKAGADGLAAINTIKSVMNVDLETFSSAPDIQGFTSIGGYSGKAVKPIALRFIAELKQYPSLSEIPVSGMGGIETWRDAAEFLSLGCSTVQITTAVMEYGYGIIDNLIDGLKRYLSMNSYASLSALLGQAVGHIVPADTLDRTSVCYPKFQHTACVGCGRCVISCFDGGHQALTISDEPGSYPVMNGKKCVGCQLCILVCPVKAILPGTRIINNKSA